MKVVIDSSFGHLQNFLCELPSGGFEFAGLQVQDGRDTLRVCSVDGIKLSVQRFPRPGFLKRVFTRMVCGSRAEAAYRNASYLTQLGVGTPRPVGYVEPDRGPLAGDSYYVSVYEDYEPVSDFMLLKDVGHNPLFRELVDFTAFLHEKGVRLRGHNMEKILYRMEPDGTCSFMVTDTDRIRFGRLSRAICLQNIGRLCVSADTAYYFAKQYAHLRNWNSYRIIAGVAMVRSFMDSRTNRRSRRKDLVRAKA